MDKWLCLGSLALSLVMLVLFACDLFIKRPFGGISVTVDVLGLIASLLLGYIAFDAFRELR